MSNIKELETWFIKALKLPAGEQIAFLEKHLNDQPELLSQVMALVRYNDKSVFTELKEQLAEEPLLEKPDIDKYTLGEELGKGGMAVVYRGNRSDGVFDHEVAVKVLMSGLEDEDFIQRFNHERNILGRLKHENIAPIYDGGLTSDGRPYFVMEIVKGEDILSYADTAELNLPQRLKLFLKVCDAIQYAHQNLIIHTDIKPSNVLVNDRGELKLMDFGISRLLEDPGLQEDQKTIFTPGYASPEQIDHQVLDVRTDVYQLGILLKELTKEVKLSKDVKLILFQAIQLEISDRYSSVEDLKRDIENFLENRPLERRKSSPGYVLLKYVQRNKIAFSVIAIAFLAIAISTYVYINRITKANQEILNEKVLAEGSLNRFLHIFEQAYPANSKGDTLTVFDLLKVGDSLNTQSNNHLVNGRFSSLVGDIYNGFNNASEAITNYKKAVYEFKQDTIGINKGRNLIFDVYAKLAAIYIKLGDADSAYHFMEISQKYVSNNELEEAYRPILYGSLAWIEVKRGNNDLADSLYQKAIDIYEIEKDSTLYYANQLAYYGRFLNYWDTPGRKEQISSLYQKAHKVFKAKGLDSLRRNDFARLINYQGLFHLDIQEFEKAEGYFSQALDINNELFGTKNLASLDNLNNLALIMLRKERYVEAREKFQMCWNFAREINVPPTSALVYYHNYASTFNLMEEYDLAKVKYDSLMAAWNELNLANLTRVNLSRIELSRSYVGLKQYDDGKRILKEVISKHKELYGDKGINDIQAGIELLKLYRKAGQKEEAMAQYQENMNNIKKRLGEDSPLAVKNEEALDVNAEISQ